MKSSRKPADSTPPEPRNKPPDEASPRPIRLVVAVLLGGAFLIAVTMAWQSIAGRALVGCGPESGCQSVLASRWGTFLGVPVSVFGAIVYGFLFAGELRRRERNSLDSQLHAMAGNLVLAGALWFLFVQAVLLRAFCPWCSAAHVLAAGGVLVGWLTRSSPTAAVRPFSLPAIALPIVAVAGMAAVQTFGPAPEHIRRVALAGDASPGRGSSTPGGDLAADPAGLPWIGAEIAAVSGIALTDFTCPHCRQLERTFSEVAEEAGVRFRVAMLPGYHDDAARDLHRVMLALWKIDRDQYRRISTALTEGALDANAAAVTAKSQGELGGRFYELAWPHGEWIEDTLRRGRETMSRNEKQLGLYTLPQLMLGGEAIAGAPSRQTLLALLRKAPAGTPAPPTPAPIAAGSAASGIGGGPRIVFESETLDLGRVTRGEKVPFTVRFTNAGNAPLEVTNIQPSCACATVTSTAPTVPPGESGSFKLEFDSSYFVGAVSKSIAVEASDPRGNGRLHFKADVWTPVLAEPRMVLFGSVIKGTPVEPHKVAITVQDAESIEIGEVTCDNPYFQWNLATIEKGRRYSLTVSIPELGETAQQGEIRIPVGHSKLAAITLPVVVSPVDRVMVHPPAIVPVAAAPAEPQPVVLRVDCNDPALAKFEIGGATYRGEGDVKVTLNMTSTRWGTLQVVLPPGFDAAAAEARNAHVVFRTNHPAYPEVRVPIRTK